MRITVFLLTTITMAMILASAGVLAAQTAPTEQPNILFVMTDDQPKDTLLAMPKVRKRIVDEGVNLTNAYVSESLCCPSREICSEVVDRRILETRGVPSQQVSKRSRRANAGGKETPRCTEYIRTRGYAKSSCSTSTRLLEPERGGCSPRPSKQRSSSTSKLPEVSAMREGTPWW